jgi:hypothetical protein
LPEPLTRELRDRLRGVVGDRWVIVDADRLLAYESDGLTAYRKTPRAVVLPKNTKEVSRLLGILSQEGCLWCREGLERDSREAPWPMVTRLWSARRE